MSAGDALSAFLVGMAYTLLVVAMAGVLLLFWQGMVMRRRDRDDP